jgi:hypothetical protein
MSTGARQNRPARAAIMFSESTSSAFFLPKSFAFRGPDPSTAARGCRRTPDRIYGAEQLRTREHRPGELEHIESVVVEALRSAALDGILSTRDDSRQRQRQLQVDRGDASPRTEEFLSAADSTGRVVRKHRGEIGDCCVSIDHHAENPM